MEKKTACGGGNSRRSVFSYINLCLFFGGGCYLALFQSWCGFSSSKSLAPEERTNNLIVLVSNNEFNI